MSKESEPFLYGAPEEDEENGRQGSSPGRHRLYVSDTSIRTYIIIVLCTIAVFGGIAAALRVFWGLEISLRPVDKQRDANLFLFCTATIPTYVVSCAHY